MSNPELTARYPGLEKLIERAAKTRALTEQDIVRAIPDLDGDLDALEAVFEFLSDQGIRVLEEDEVDLTRRSRDVRRGGCYPGAPPVGHAAAVLRPRPAAEAAGVL